MNIKRFNDYYDIVHREVNSHPFKYYHMPKYLVKGIIMRYRKKLIAAIFSRRQAVNLRGTLYFTPDFKNLK